MLFPNLGKWVFLYILDRLKVFSNVSPDKLKVSIWRTSHFTLDNVELDTESLVVNGLRVRSATIRSIDAELSTSGIKTVAEGAEIVVKIGDTHTDLAISALLDRTAGDMARSVAELARENDAADLSDFTDLPDKQEAETGYGMGDTSGIVSRLANAILAQISVDVSNITVKVLVEEEALMNFRIDKLTVPYGGKIEISGVVCEQLAPIYSSNGSEVDEEEELSSAAAARDPKATGGSVSFAPGISDIDSASDSDSDEAYGAMSQSMYFDSQSQFLAAARAEVALAAIDEESEAPPQLYKIDLISLEHTIPLNSIKISIPKVSVALISTLRIAVEAINAFCSSDFSGDASDQKVSFQLDVGAIELCEPDLNSVLAVLEGLSISLDKVSLQGLSIPGVQISSPVFTATIGPEVEVILPHPISVSIPLQQLSFISNFCQQLTTLLLKIDAAERPEPTTFSVRLSEIKLAVGALSLMIFPGPITHEGLVIDEVTISSDAGSRILIKAVNLEFNGLVGVIDSIKADSNSDFVCDVQAINDALAPTASASVIPPAHEVPVFSLHIRDVRVCHDSQLWKADRGVVAKHMSTNSWLLESAVSVKDDAMVFKANLSALYVARVWKVSLNDFSGDWWPSLAKPTANTPVVAAGVAAEPTKSAPSATRYELKISGGVKVHTPYVTQISFTAHGSGTDSQLKLRAMTRIYLIDPSDHTMIPVGSIEDAQMTIVWSPFTLKALVNDVSLAVCADSFSALAKNVEYLQPASTAPSFSLDCNKEVDIFTGVNEHEFQYTPPPPRAPASSDTSIAEDFFDQDLDELVHNFQASPVDPIEVNLVENYVSQTATCLSGQVAQLAAEVKIHSLSLKLYDGFDIKSTRQELREAVERVKQEAEAIVDSDITDDYIGDFLYNSIYIGTKSGFMSSLKEQVDEEVGSPELARGEKPKVTLAVTDATLSVQHPHDEEGVPVSTTRITAQDVVVWDNVSTSKWDMVLCADPQRQREQRIPIFDLVIENVLTAAPEVRHKAAVQPLRVTVDQDTLDFLTRFLQFELSAEDPDPHPKMSEPKSDAPFIQRFELVDLPLVISYLPKKVDYEGLRSGHTVELMNLFEIKGSSMVLRHIVVYGQSGYDRLGQSLLEHWFSDVANSQLTDVLGGIGFLYPVIKAGRTIRNLVIIPVRGYSKDGSALIGMHRGAAKFAKSTTKQLRRRMNKWLEKGELELALEDPKPGVADENAGTQENSDLNTI